jgi:hypothetical protein
VPQFLKISGTERAVDDTMAATHRDRHAMADDHLVVVINSWDFRDLAHGENETLGRINHGGAAGTGVKTLPAGNKRPAFRQRH